MKLLLKNSIIDGLFRLLTMRQARSQKFAMGGLCLGVWGKIPQPTEARGFGGGSPSARKFCIVLQIKLNFRAILIKNNAFKT